MFLLNSRDPLVTATCDGNSTLPLQASLIPKVQDYFAEFPRLRYTRYILDFSSSAPVSDLGTIIIRRSLHIFSWSLGLEQTQLTPSHSHLELVLVIATLPNSRILRQNDGSASPIRKRMLDYNAPIRYLNINKFPVRSTLLRLILGSTNSRLTTHCRETLTLTMVEILTPLCCYCRQDLQ